jgi:hypothetical protein
MTAITLFNKLREESIVGSIGESTFTLNSMSTIIKDSSIVGNVIQEWLKKFMDTHGILYRLKPNTQEFPDFLMDGSDCQGLLEVKCFKESPNFDIANFQAYARSLLVTPYRLDADYLIFEYAEHNNGIIIKDMWLKKVWEISGPSERSPLKIQWKQSVPVNIRPAIWNPRGVVKYPPFSTRKEFVEAIKKVIDTSSISGGIQRGWFNRVEALYREQTGNEL